MEPVAISEIVAAVRGELIRGELGGVVSGVSTDTRTIKPGDLFFALIGENADGHQYIAKAVEFGAAGIVLSKDVEVPGTAAIIKVPDVLVSLGDLATVYCKKFNYRTVAITGSVGKTTTKEMTASVLAKCFSVQKNIGNFNNEIGLPFTLFGLTHDHQVAVLEMAMRGPGEIRRLCQIARPQVGVITNIGVTHIERLGSRDAIAAAKAELLEELPESGSAILNADDNYFEFLKSKFSGRTVSYGYSETADVRASDVKLDESGCASFVVETPGGISEISLSVPGEHNVTDALAAVAVGLEFDVPLSDIADALAAYVPPDKRANVLITKFGVTVLDDTYNASPASVTGALKTLKVMNGARKIAVLGDMLELGDHAHEAHASVGRASVECCVDRLITVGPLSRSTVQGAMDAGLAAENITSFETSEEAGTALKTQVQKGDVVLVKGSRGMKMEKVVEALIGD